MKAWNGTQPPPRGQGFYPDEYPSGIYQPIPREWMRPTREEVDDLRRRVERLEDFLDDVRRLARAPRCMPTIRPSPLRPEDV
jgi:hypothetical protein